MISFADTSLCGAAYLVFPNAGRLVLIRVQRTHNRRAYWDAKRLVAWLTGRATLAPLNMLVIRTEYTDSAPWPRRQLSALLGAPSLTDRPKRRAVGSKMSGNRMIGRMLAVTRMGQQDHRIAQVCRKSQRNSGAVEMFLSWRLINKTAGAALVGSLLLSQRGAIECWSVRWRVRNRSSGALDKRLAQHVLLGL
jgi:hypothetical protein